MNEFPHHVGLDYTSAQKELRRRLGLDQSYTSSMIDFSSDHAKKILRKATIGNAFAKEAEMRDKLFQYAVVFHPKVTKADTDEARRVRSQLLIEPTTILARDEAEVRAKAYRAIDPQYDEKLDQIEVLVVPFA